MNLDDLILVSNHPLDKIVVQGSGSVNHPGAIAYSSSFIVNYPDVRTVEAWADHDYGRAMLVRAVFSVDGGASWQEINNLLQFSWEMSYRENNVPIPIGNYIEAGPQMHVSVGCDNSRIYFRLQSNYFTYSTLVFNVNTSTGVATVSGWTAAAQTVMLKFWAYERD